MDLRKKKYFHFVFLVLRSLLLYFVFGLFSLCSSLTILNSNYNIRDQYTYLPDQAVYALGVFFSLIFYYSLIYASIKYSNTLRTRYLLIWDPVNQPGFIQRLKFTLHSPEFLSDLIIHTLLLLIFPSEFGFWFLTLLLGNNSNKGLLFLILIPAIAFLCFSAHLSVLSNWNTKWRDKVRKPNLDKIPLWKLPIHIFFIWICFLVVCSLSPIEARTLYALSQILKLANSGTLLLFIIGIIFLWFVIRYLIAVEKRIRFLHRIKRICKKNGYELLNVKRYIRTLFFPSPIANFSIKNDSVQFDCRMISSMDSHFPLLFREDGTVTCTHFLRFFSLNLFHFDFTYDYQFDGTGIKVLILLPASKKVFVCGYGVTQFAFSGSRIADCVIYGATDFLHALERKVVGR